MTILPPLSDEEYVVLKRMLAGIDAIEADYTAQTGRRFRDASTAELRGADDYTATLRAAVEGYEAAKGSTSDQRFPQDGKNL